MSVITDFDTDVLVVGLGPMGATTALALATYGIRVHAISRQNWLADTPRAHITNLRAAEVLRSLGIEEEIKQQTKATIRVLPDAEFRTPDAPTTCIWTGRPATIEAVWAKAY